LPSCSVLSPTVSTEKRRRWRADRYRSNEERSRTRAGVRLLSRSDARGFGDRAVPSRYDNCSRHLWRAQRRARHLDPHRPAGGPGATRRSPHLLLVEGGEWYRVDPEAEAADFVDGVPRKAREVSFVAAPGGGFVQKRRPVPIDVALIACHGGPGEDGTLQGALDLARIRYTGPDQASSALGMDKFTFGAAMR